MSAYDVNGKEKLVHFACVVCFVNSGKWIGTARSRKLHSISCWKGEFGFYDDSWIASFEK